VCVVLNKTISPLGLSVPLSVICAMRRACCAVSEMPTTCKAFRSMHPHAASGSATRSMYVSLFPTHMPSSESILSIVSLFTLPQLSFVEPERAFVQIALEVLRAE